MTSDFRLKLNRADDHLQRLTGLIDSFLSSNPAPYRLTSEFDSNLPGYRVWGHVVREPDEWWLPIIGDFFYDLRSSLDNLAYSLAGPNAGSHTEFPVFSGKPIFREREGQVRRPSRRSGLFKMVGMPARVKAIIEDFQPYTTRTPLPPTNMALRFLHALNIEDKHHRLNLVAAATSTVTQSIDDPQFVPMAYTRNSYQIFSHGQELEPIRNFFSSTNPLARDLVSATFDIALDPLGPGKGMSLKKCLLESWKATEEIITRLEPYVRPAQSPTI